ncbi:MAG: hypothetical protein PHV85_09755 [Desulfovibrionaceae bacterium]|nr:hypothetical protein [Desulfovibrionaceae bacterium]
MADYQDFAGELEQEVLSEIAEGFFGARKRLEAMIESLWFVVEKLKATQNKFSAAAAELNRLLLDGALAPEFYARLGVDPLLPPFGQNGPQRPGRINVPLALTRAGRYSKLVLGSYEALQDLAHEYMHGRHYDDPTHKGRKKLTVHYLQVVELWKAVSARIQVVNRDLAPSAILQYVKKFDAETEEKEGIAGCPMPAGQGGLDKDLGFAAIEFESLGLREAPELPRPDKVAGEIKAFCRRACKTHGPEIEALIKSLRARDVKAGRP